MCWAEFILPDLIRFLKAREIRHTEFSFMTHVGLSWTIHWGCHQLQKLGHITSFSWFSEKWTWPVVIIIRATNLHMDRRGWVFVNEGRGGDVWKMHIGRQERKCPIEASPWHKDRKGSKATFAVLIYPNWTDCWVSQADFLWKCQVSVKVFLCRV